jgi:hypothetical protein
MDGEFEEIFANLDRIEKILTSQSLPHNAAGDLMSASLVEFYDRLSERLARLQRNLPNKA